MFNKAWILCASFQSVIWGHSTVCCEIVFASEILDHDISSQDDNNANRISEYFRYFSLLGMNVIKIIADLSREIWETCIFSYSSFYNYNDSVISTLNVVPSIQVFMKYFI